MSVTTETEHNRPPGAAGTDVALVDPRAPRFGQTITTVGLGLAVLADVPLLLYATTAVLALSVGSRWRLDAYAVLWRYGVRPVVGPPAEREPAAPHRFARVLGAVGATLASVFVLGGVPLVGYAVAGAVAALAGLAAVTGFCLGCRMYRQVAFFRRLNVV